MKRFIRIHFFLAFFLCSFSACDKDEVHVLPQESQSGKNTFGCMINNQLFIGGGHYSFIGYSPLSAGYDRNRKQLTISAISKVDTDKANGTIGLVIMNPIQDSVIKLSTATYQNGSTDSFQFLVINDGKVFLTKLDTVSGIVSGRFSFNGKRADRFNTFVEKDDSVKITEGRFDVTLTITND